MKCFIDRATSAVERLNTCIFWCGLAISSAVTVVLKGSGSLSWAGQLTQVHVYLWLFHSMLVDILRTFLRIGIDESFPATFLEHPHHLLWIFQEQMETFPPHFVDIFVTIYKHYQNRWTPCYHIFGTFSEQMSELLPHFDIYHLLLLPHFYRLNGAWSSLHHQKTLFSSSAGHWSILLCTRMHRIYHHCIERGSLLPHIWRLEIHESTSDELRITWFTQKQFLCSFKHWIWC